MVFIKLYAVIYALSIFLIVISYYEAKAYKPVIIIHGLMEPSEALNCLQNYIQKNHNGTKVSIIRAYEVLESFTPLWTQVEGFKDLIRKDPNYNCSLSCAILIGYSQGGLIARAIIETMDDHCFCTFISLSGPQRGVKCLGPLRKELNITDRLWPVLLDPIAALFYYNPRAQGSNSVPNMWYDPNYFEKYLAENIFLPKINGENSTSSNLTAYKKNFLKLNLIVLFGGPDDGILCPWQSAFFGYAVNEKYSSMEEQSFYINDTFGLKTKNENGSIITYNIANITHLQWPCNPTVKQNILEHLD